MARYVIRAETDQEIRVLEKVGLKLWRRNMI